MEAASRRVSQLLAANVVNRVYKFKTRCLRARIQTFGPSLKIQTLRRSLVAVGVDIRT